MALCMVHIKLKVLIETSQCWKHFTSWFWSLQTSERKSHNMTMFKSMGPYCKVLSSFFVLSDYLITSECLWIMWKDTSSSICRCFFLWLYGSIACSCLLLFVCFCVILLIQSLFKNRCLKYLFFSSSLSEKWVSAWLTMTTRITTRFQRNYLCRRGFAIHLLVILYNASTHFLIST